MYVWPESVAHRGSNEVTSCLHHYFQNLSGANTFHLFFLILVLDKIKTPLWSISRLFQQIRHIFLIRGHSFLPCDRDFAKTETKKKRKLIASTLQTTGWMLYGLLRRLIKPFQCCSSVSRPCLWLSVSPVACFQENGTWNEDSQSKSFQVFNESLSHEGTPDLKGEMAHRPDYFTPSCSSPKIWHNQ